VNKKDLVENTIFLYFQNLLNDCLDKTGFLLSDLSKQYLTNLLTTFADPVMLHEFGTNYNGTTPLVVLYENALYKQREERTHAFKRLGDVSLFVSGFLNDSVITNSLFGYYADMGKLGYAEASGVGGHPVYSELSQKFCEVIEILIDVSCMTTMNNTQTIDKLYDRYTYNNMNQLLLKKLTNRGAVPVIIKYRI